MPSIGELDLLPAGSLVFGLFGVYLPPSKRGRDVYLPGQSRHLVSHLNSFISRRDKSKSAVDLLPRWSVLISMIYSGKEKILQIVFLNLEIVSYQTVSYP